MARVISKSGSTDKNLQFMRFQMDTILASATSPVTSFVVQPLVGKVDQISTVSDSLDMTVTIYDAVGATNADKVAEVNMVGASSPVVKSFSSIQGGYAIDTNTNPSKNLWIKIVNNDGANATGVIDMAVGIIEGK